MGKYLLGVGITFAGVLALKLAYDKWIADSVPDSAVPFLPDALDADWDDVALAALIALAVPAVVIPLARKAGGTVKTG